MLGHQAAKLAPSHMCRGGGHAAPSTHTVCLQGALTQQHHYKSKLHGAPCSGVDLGTQSNTVLVPQGFVVAHNSEHFHMQCTTKRNCAVQLAPGCILVHLSQQVGPKKTQPATKWALQNQA